MSGFLIDTHVLIWWADTPEKLSNDARVALASGRNTLFVSHASLWELNIKISRGKLSIPGSIETLLQRSRCDALAISMNHIDRIKELPHHHGDPFDRMLIAQAQCERITLVTRDRDMFRYDVPVIAA